MEVSPSGLSISAIRTKSKWNCCQLNLSLDGDGKINRGWMLNVKLSHSGLSLCARWSRRCGKCDPSRKYRAFKGWRETLLDFASEL